MCNHEYNQGCAQELEYKSYSESGQEFGKETGLEYKYIYYYRCPALPMFDWYNHARPPADLDTHPTNPRMDPC